MFSPQGTMPAKCVRSGSTLRLTPWKLTQWRTRMPMLAILASPTKTPICPSWRFALDAELSERGDEPVFQRVHESAHVAAAAPKIEHHISHALARTMIGEAAAAAGAKHWEPRRLDQLFRRGAGSGGVEGRMLEQPHGLRRAGLEDRRHARVHGLDRRLVRHRLAARQPFDVRRGGGLRLKRKDGRIGQGQPRNTLTAQT